MKRFIIIAALLAPVLFSCNGSSLEEANNAENVVLSKDKIDLRVGESVTLSATVLPKSLGMSVVWSVVDESIAQVAEDGTVTGKAKGVTYVLATSEDGLQKGSCMVSVNPNSFTISVIGKEGHPLAGIYGYPGMAEPLSIVASDGKAHSFTCTIEDESVATISPDGVLSMKAQPTSKEDFAFYAETCMVIRSEEGYGCRIPICSNLLKGVKLDETFYTASAGGIITVRHSNSYPISFLYQGEAGPEVIPADDIQLELSDATYFSIRRIGDIYALFTEHTGSVSSKLLLGTSAINPKVELAEFEIQLLQPELVCSSSSTLTFGWTEGMGVNDDINRPYTITLYTDENCGNALLSYSIPAGDGCWRYTQPRFIFTGLDSNTTYWFKVTDTGNDGGDGPVISGTTDAFTIVEPSDTPAGVGDIILAEDFSEMCWYADEVSRAAGYEVGTVASATFQNRTVNSFTGFTGQYNGNDDYGIMSKHETARKASRLGKWAQGYNARMYVGPGYLFLGTYSYGTHLITPQLNNIPEGSTAKIQVTVHAAGFKKDYRAALAVQKSNVVFWALNSNATTNKDKLNLDDNVQYITYTGGVTTLEEFTVTLEGVEHGDRIAFGPPKTTVTKDGKADYVKTNENMMLISDMTIQIIELQQ